MREVIRNEWRFLLRNRVLQALSLGFVVFLAISVVLGKMQVKQQSEQYEAAKNHLRAQWEDIQAMNPHGAAHYGTYVFKPSNLLSSLDEGVSSVTGNVLRVEGHVQNEMVYSEASQMQVISKFGKLKSSLLLQYILPLLLVFLAFHTIYREKQSARMKMVLVQGASPSNIIWSKTLAIWLYGVSLLAITILIYGMMNWQNISSDVLVRALLLFASYALYYFIVTGLTVFFTARWRNATLALTSMLGVWILWSVFLPNILMTSVEKLHELPSRNAFQIAMKEDRAQGLDGHNPADERAKTLEREVLKEYGVDSLAALPINFDGLVMQADEEYGNKVWDKHFGHLNDILIQQKQSYQLAGIINPFASLQNASMGFAASDNLHYQAFLRQVEDYRRVFIKQLNDEHAFGGSKTGDWGWTADNAFFRSVPDYEYQPVLLSSVLPFYLTDLVILTCWSLLVALLLTMGVRKMPMG